MKYKMTPLWPKIVYNNEIPRFNEHYYEKLVSIIKERVDDFDIHMFDHLQTIDDLYDRIVEKIDEYVKMDQKTKEKYPIENIFHMIQVWGGKTGRNIYCIINKKSVTDKDVNVFRYNWDKNKYLNIINACLKIKYDKKQGYNNKALSDLIDVLKNNRMNQLGPAFITKHVSFWTKNKLGNNALPIFDSVIKSNLYRNNNSPQLNELLTYWKHMSNKAQKENSIGVASLERQLFVYFRNHPINNSKSKKTKTNIKTDTYKNKISDNFWDRLKKRITHLGTPSSSRGFCQLKGKYKDGVQLRINVFKNGIKKNGYQSISITHGPTWTPPQKLKDEYGKMFDESKKEYLVIRNTNPMYADENKKIEWFVENINKIIEILK